jgi:hypothetical protein
MADASRIRVIRVLIPGPAGPPGPISGTLENVAELKATNIAVGERVETYGYYVGGDGGRSIYRIVAGGTGPADDAFFINMANGNQAQLILADPATMHVRQLGCIADGVTSDDARIAIGEASTVQNFNYAGLTVFTNRTANTQLLKNYYGLGGGIIGESITSEDPTTGADNPVVVHPRWQIADTDIQRPRTKSPVIDWPRREVLANGTSITQQGGDFDSYFTLAMNTLGAHCTNMGWAGSSVCYDLNASPSALSTIKRLSMTEDDRLAGLALYGSSSVYDDSFDAITKASQMTCDYRIKRLFQNYPISVWFLDHNHNDRGRTPGTLTPESHTITTITKGTTTQITVNAIGTIVVGNAVAVRVTGIALLDYAAARVQAVAGNVITLNINSSAYVGTFSAGSLVKLDRNTIYGGWEFLLYYARNCAIVFGTGALSIVLCTAPSEYTNGVYSKEIFSIGTYIKKIAAKWGVAVFDGTYEYNVTLQDQPIYFDDLIHPLTLPQRQAYANHIVRFCQGGAVRVPDPDEFLPSGSQDYTDGGIATYSEFHQGFGTFTRFFGDPVEVLRQDFTAGLTGWTVAGPAPVIAASPWSPSEQAALFTASVATPSAYISHSLILGTGREIHCTFSLPSISNLCDVSAPVPATVTLFSLRSSGSYYLFNFAIRNPATVQTRAQYFETPNTTLHSLLPQPNTTMAAATRYDVIIKCYQGLAVDDLGRFLIYINGALVGGPYELNDFGQTAIAELRVGAIASNTGKNFNVYIGNIIAYDLPAKGPPAGGRKYFFMVDGQSNVVNRPAFTWSPPANLRYWNWDYQAGHVGTAFPPLDGTITSLGRSFGAAFAKLHPSDTIYICNTGFGGKPIRNWIGGPYYTFSTNTDTTTSPGPGAGFIRLNNSIPASVTQVAISVVDAVGATRYGSNFPSYGRFRISKTGDPTKFVEFTPGVATWLDGLWYRIDASAITSGGTLADNDPLTISTDDPDAYKARKDNQLAAMAAAGVTKIDALIWWQGESDSLAQDHYVDDFETLQAKSLADGLLSYDTPILISGVSEFVSGDSGGPGLWQWFNKSVQRVANSDPERRMFVRPSAIPSSFWEIPISGGLHMTAAGYDLAGALFANILTAGASRPVVPAMLSKPGTKVAEFEAGSAAVPAITFAGMTGGFYRSALGEFGLSLSNIPPYTSPSERMRFGSLGIAIGTGASPAQAFETKRTGTGAAPNVGVWKKSGEYIEQIHQILSSGDATGPSWISHKSRGTLATPTIVLQNDNIYQVDANAYDGTLFRFSMRHSFKIIEPTPGPTKMAGELIWSLSALGTVAINEAFAVSQQEMRFKGSQFLDSNRFLMLPSQTVAQLNAITATAGKVAFCTNEAGGAVLVFGDGTNWRRVTDRAVIS